MPCMPLSEADMRDMNIVPRYMIQLNLCFQIWPSPSDLLLYLGKQREMVRLSNSNTDGHAGE